MLKKALIILLAAIMCLGTVACATTPPEQDTTATTQAPGETVAETETEAELTIELPEDLDYKGASFTIYVDKGLPDVVGFLDGGDVVASAVHERNKMAEQRLHVKLDIVEDTSGDALAAANRMILANDDDLDLVAGVQWCALPNAWQGMYADMSNATYTDWEKPWWANEYMDTIQWNESRYVMIGDISVSMLKCMSAFFVNKPLFEDNFGSIDKLYETVFDGKWTWEMMAKYVSDVYVDKNSNGRADEEDVLGLFTYCSSPTDHFAYTAGLSFSYRDTDGNILLYENQERNVQVAETIYDLMFENKGVFFDCDGLIWDIHAAPSFAEGRSLFYPLTITFADLFRDMQDPYAIITYPKLDLKQEDYKTLIHDNATVFAVPNTVKDTDLHGAVLEALCYEGYKRVTPAYYDVVLKSRYSQDPYSAKAIDMLRANVSTDFVYANTYTFGNTVNLGTIMRTLTKEQSNNYASTYKKLSMRMEKQLDRINKGQTGR